MKATSAVLLMLVVLVAGAVASAHAQTLLFTLDTPNPQAGPQFGILATVGEVNDDGKADITVAAYNEDVGGNTDQGRAYVFSGADGSLLYTLDTPNPQAEAEFGYPVAVGDVNGDGRGDIAVGARWEDVGGNDGQGRAYVFSPPAVPVGGIARLPELSDSSSPNYIFLAGAVAAALLALIAGTWYARRRWLASGSEPVQADNDFLDVDFSYIDDPKARKLVEKFHGEAANAYRQRLYIAAVFVSGAVMEGILQFALLRQQPKAQQRYREMYGSEKAKERPSPADWRLNELIKIAYSMEVIGEDANRLARDVENFRNLIHPYKLVRRSEPGWHRLARIAFDSVAEISRSLSGRLSRDTSQQVINAVEDLGGSLDFTWLIQGEVAGCAAPMQQADLHYLRSRGIGAVVRLAHPDTDLVIMERTHVMGAGLDDLHVPVPDFTGPTSDQINQVLRFMYEKRRIGKAVAVSCGAGCGRTGVMLACYLITLEYSADDALEFMISKRPCSKEILEALPEQRNAIYEFQTHFDSGEARF